MSKPKGYPHRQQFNIKEPNNSKKKGWWIVGYRKAEQTKKKD